MIHSEQLDRLPGRNVIGTDGEVTGADLEVAESAAMRSEEELHVSTHGRVAGKARPRKHIVTDHVTRTIPARREEVTIAREPVDECVVGRPTDGRPSPRRSTIADSSPRPHPSPDPAAPARRFARRGMTPHPGGDP